ncbi:MAG: AGE family epimerase/isomerase, partial [Victivallaceae bacterium]|nr:AGE family epimerase/isomerase [Victivallaceae bacterium]
CEDQEYGGYFTCLDRDGSVFDSEKYMWMQWRIVYMFATLYMSEYSKPQWLDIARRGFDFLVKNGKSSDGSYYFSLNRRGEPSSAPSNIFSDCFAAMGAAAMYKATGAEQFRMEADSAMRSYIRRLDHPKGRWDKAMPGRAKRLSLGHFMILANLCNVMSENLGTEEYDNDAQNAVVTVMEKFWNPEFQIIFENVNPDGSFDLNSCDGRMINPGHGLESMWFIMQYAEKKHDLALCMKAAEITDALFKFGTDRKFGGIYYFMDVLNKPPMELHWDMKLWWPHNEAMIAALFAHRLTGDPKFLKYFSDTDQWSWQNFRDLEYGEWYGYLNRRGEPTHSLKGGKWKTFFHLPRYLLISIEQMKMIHGGK